MTRSKIVRCRLIGRGRTPACPPDGAARPSGTRSASWGARLLGAGAMVWLAAIWLAPFGLAPGCARTTQLAAVAAYAAGARVCHQRPDRSFRVSGRQMPVCARCAGLYTAAPFGILLAVAARRAARAWSAGRWRAVLAVAAAPTLLTLAAEWSGIGTDAPARFAAALPLGAAVAFLLGVAVDVAEAGWRVGASSASDGARRP